MARGSFLRVIPIYLLKLHFVNFTIYICLLKSWRPDFFLSLSFRYFWTMVTLPKVPNCCACASLKTGTLIIGSLNLVASVVGILAAIGFMAGSTVSPIFLQFTLQLCSEDRLKCFLHYVKKIFEYKILFSLGQI